MTIQEIKQQLRQASINNYEQIIATYHKDDRIGVQKEIKKTITRIENMKLEQCRIEEMKQYEYQNWNEYDFICGIDEVGRGPLAGPVFAAAVIFPKNVDILYINDSKQLSEKKREELYKKIKDQAIAIGVGMADVETIDAVNILQANYIAMRQAISKLYPQPQLLLNDAVTIPDVTIPQIPIIKGDTKSISIAAASIIAKVERDHLMQIYDEMYPEYGFSKNKGYGSAEHISAIQKFGPCAIHRKTFITHFI